MWHQICIYSFLFAVTLSWNLQTFDDSGQSSVTINSDYSVIHVSIFYVRAFLTIRNRYNSSNQVTIIESTWPENLLPIQSRIFPNQLSHAKSQCDCNGIVQTIQTAIDRNNGLLWLIDNGSKLCAPKLLIFDLLRGNNEIHRHVFNDLRDVSFKAIHLQTFSNENKMNNLISIEDTRAIILLQNRRFLLIYSPLENGPIKLNLLKGDTFKNEFLIPDEIAMKSNEELLICDHFNQLWSADIGQIHLSKSSSNQLDAFSVVNVPTKYIGSLLGLPKALTINPSSMDSDSINTFLYYYLPRDGVVLRWNYRQPLTAEGHDILYFAKRPVKQIVFGVKGSVWIIFEYADELGDHCRRVLNFLSLNGPRFSY